MIFGSVSTKNPLLPAAPAPQPWCRPIKEDSASRGANASFPADFITLDVCHQVICGKVRSGIIDLTDILQAVSPTIYIVFDTD